MDVLLLVVVILGIVINIVVIRYFTSQLSKKISFFNTPPFEGSNSSTTGTLPLDKKNPLFKSGRTGSYSTDPPTKNQIAEDEEDLELNEQNISGFPKDVRIEVEGGDTHTPPGFNEKKEGK